MSLQVVEDDGVPGSQHRDEAVGDVAAEAGAVGGAIDETERAQAGAAQGGCDGGSFVVALRHEEPAPLTARGASVTAGHVGGGRGLVEEDQRVRVEVGQGLEPGLAGLPYVGPLLLSRIESPFLRVMPWRAKKRDTVPDAAIGPLIRGARAVIGWSIQDLAAASGVSGSSVRRMEEFGEGPRPKIRQAVRQAFESAGIRFSALGADRVAIEVDLARFPPA